jgi:hypothetical protein
VWTVEDLETVGYRSGVEAGFQRQHLVEVEVQIAHGSEIVEGHAPERQKDLPLRTVHQRTRADADDPGHVALEALRRLPGETGGAGESRQIDAPLVDRPPAGNILEKCVQRRHVGFGGAVAQRVVGARDEESELLRRHDHAAQRIQRPTARVHQNQQRPRSAVVVGAGHVDGVGLSRVGWDRHPGNDLSCEVGILGRGVPGLAKQAHASSQPVRLWEVQ